MPPPPNMSSNQPKFSFGGQPENSKPASSLFSQNSSSTKETPSNPTGSIFGAPNTSSTPFGSFTATTGGTSQPSVFGSTTLSGTSIGGAGKEVSTKPGSSLFGGTAASGGTPSGGASPFGSAGFSFGQTPNNTSGSGSFLTPNKTSGPSSSGSGQAGGLFGSGNAGAGSIFGNLGSKQASTTPVGSTTPATTQPVLSFGNPSTTPAGPPPTINVGPSASSGLFLPKSQQPSSTLFGAKDNVQKPDQQAPATTAPPGSFGNAGKPLFGSQDGTVNALGTKASGPATSGLFNTTSNSGASNLFGNKENSQKPTNTFGNFNKLQGDSAQLPASSTSNPSITGQAKPALASPDQTQQSAAPKLGGLFATQNSATPSTSQQSSFPSIFGGGSGGSTNPNTSGFKLPSAPTSSNPPLQSLPAASTTTPSLSGLFSGSAATQPAAQPTTASTTTSSAPSLFPSLGKPPQTSNTEQTSVAPNTTASTASSSTLR